MEHQPPATDDLVIQVSAAAVAAVDDRSSTSQHDASADDDGHRGEEGGGGGKASGYSRRTFSQHYKPAHRKPTDFTRWQVLLLSYQSLGIVYGDLGTSPLYVFSSIKLANPGEEDFLGILSLILWTLTVISLVKYTFVVLNADDMEC